jgi:hypothetical protein
MRETQHDYLNSDQFISREIRKSIMQFPIISVNQPTRNGHCNF